MLATGGDGVDARVVVLRAADPDRAELTFFTDARAAKAGAIVAAPRVAVVAWDPTLQLQVRLHGSARIATDGAPVDAAFAQVPVGARRAYRTTVAPGTPSATAAVDENGDQAGGGRANFAVITVTVDRVEWLDLAGPSHRRAAFIRADGTWVGSWLVP